VKRSHALLFVVFVCVAISSLVGCASIGVEVWERDVLAKTEMQFDNDPLNLSIDDHIYFSKEGSSGGRGFGGGGCGCN
jgi:hypothetical protein